MSKANIEAHYDAVTKTYSEQYERDKIFDITRSYPANYFRMQLLINSFIRKDVKSRKNG